MNLLSRDPHKWRRQSSLVPLARHVPDFPLCIRLSSHDRSRAAVLSFSSSPRPRHLLGSFQARQPAIIHTTRAPPLFIKKRPRAKAQLVAHSSLFTAEPEQVTCHGRCHRCGETNDAVPAPHSLLDRRRCVTKSSSCNPFPSLHVSRGRRFRDITSSLVPRRAPRSAHRSARP